MAKRKPATEAVKTENKEAAKPAQEVATRPSGAVQAGSVDDVAAWGSGNVNSQDIIIPRILLMQPMSEKVTAGEAKFTEFVDSLTGEVLGSLEKPFKVIPFKVDKVWIEFDVTDPEDKKFLRVTPITPDNENLPYEDEEKNEAGKKFPVMRDRTMNFYVLIPDQIDNGGAIPYILSARRSSLQAGKKLMTQMFVKNPAAGKNPAAILMEISCSKTTNEKKQTWAVMDAKAAGPSTSAHQLEAFKWLQTITAGKARAHAESYQEEARTESDAGSKATAATASGPAKF